MKLFTKENVNVVKKEFLTNKKESRLTAKLIPTISRLTTNRNTPFKFSTKSKEVTITLWSTDFVCSSREDEIKIKEVYVGYIECISSQIMNSDEYSKEEKKLSEVKEDILWKDCFSTEYNRNTKICFCERKSNVSTIYFFDTSFENLVDRIYQSIKRMNLLNELEITSNFDDPNFDFDESWQQEW